MIDISTLDVRDIVLLFAVLTMGYAVFTVLRLWRVSRKQRKQKFSLYANGKSHWVPGYTEGSEPKHLSGSSQRVVDFPTGSLNGEHVPKDAISEPVFAEELERSKLEIEMQRLRREVEQLRAETTHLANEIRYLKTARNVSPLYSEAMTLAQQDVPAAGIADQCGISIGEAELVAALARGEPGFEVHKNEEDQDDRYTDSRN
ncbi:MAG: DUF2802 domain-containing protein [Sulfuritalea sp.]|nr:DUF2802 domain-containing protein [Sulfuritalea sp.]